MDGQMWVFVSILAFLLHGSDCQKKLVCIDTKQDLETAGWKFNSEIKSAANSAGLPKGLGDLKRLEGSGIWYVEGPSSGPAKEVTLTSLPSLYTTRASRVQIYIKYFENSPRRISLFPAKAGGTGGPLLLLPVSAQTRWTEVREEIEPRESPIEVTGHLGANQFILFEKIVVAVDSPLPSDLSMSCESLTSSPTLSPPTIGTTPSRRSPQPGGTIRPPSTPTTLSTSDCPALPTLPECKCNCMCNCANCAKC